MSPPPRRLSFSVGTSLLTASLAAGTVGCKKDNVNVNVAHPPPDDVHVNEGPAPEPDEVDEPEPEPKPDGPNVNTVPDAE